MYSQLRTSMMIHVRSLRIYYEYLTSMRTIFASADAIDLALPGLSSESAGKTQGAPELLQTPPSSPLSAAVYNDEHCMLLINSNAMSCVQKEMCGKIIA